VRHVQLAKALEVAEPDGKSGEEILPRVQIFETSRMMAGRGEGSCIRF